jgi:aspartate 1-decarboxylase
VNGKIHQLKVTGLQPKYSGSCLICPELLDPLDNSIAETLRYSTADDALVRQVNVLED